MRLASLLAVLIAVLGPLSAAEPPVQRAVLAAGCFWCLESIFEGQPGVVDVRSGYAGGHTENPTYEQSNTGKTGHVEAVEIIFDPAKTNFSRLLDLYWKSFDPTEGRGVEPDFGPQYEPRVFFLNDAQRETAEASKAAVQKNYAKPIAVKIAPLDRFWPAEGYHQDFVRNNPNHPYVRNVSNERKERATAAQP